MRVLNPTNRNPLYALAHKVTEKLGVAGATFTTGAVTLGGPAAAGMFMAPEYFVAGAIAIPAFMVFGKYKGRVKENARLNLAYELRRKINKDDYPEVDAVIAEIFACQEKHEKFQADEERTTYSYNTHSLSPRKVSQKELDAAKEKLEKKKAHDHILTLGNSCEYCGNRLQAMELLVVESKSVVDRMVDDSRLNSLLEIAERRRYAKQEYDKEFNKKTAYDEVKELTSGR